MLVLIVNPNPIIKADDVEKSIVDFERARRLWRIRRYIRSLTILKQLQQPARIERQGRYWLVSVNSQPLMTFDSFEAASNFVNSGESL